MKAKKKIDFQEYLGKFPSCFINYMNYVRNLKFDQKPDY